LTINFDIVDRRSSTGDNGDFSTLSPTYHQQIHALLKQRWIICRGCSESLHVLFTSKSCNNLCAVQI